MGAVRPTRTSADRGSGAAPCEPEDRPDGGTDQCVDLDATWGRLTVDDLPLFDTWGLDAPVPTGARAAVREAWEHSKLTVLACHSMHGALKPWVIRHERPYRRDITPGQPLHWRIEHGVGGLRIRRMRRCLFCSVPGPVGGARREEGTPSLRVWHCLFLRGLQAARLGQKDAVRDSDLNDDDRDGSSHGLLVTVNGIARDSVVWYRCEIDQAIAYAEERDAHPKVRATVEKALQLSDRRREMPRVLLVHQDGRGRRTRTREAR